MNFSIPWVFEYIPQFDYDFLCGVVVTLAVVGSIKIFVSYF